MKNRNVMFSLVMVISCALGIYMFAPIANAGTPNSYTGQWENAHFEDILVPKNNPRCRYLKYTGQTLKLEPSGNDYKGYLTQTTHLVLVNGDIGECEIKGSKADHYAAQIKSWVVSARKNGNQLKARGHSGECRELFCKSKLSMESLSNVFIQGAGSFSTNLVMQDDRLVDDFGTPDKNDDNYFYPSDHGRAVLKKAEHVAVNLSKLWHAEKCSDVSRLVLRRVMVDESAFISACKQSNRRRSRLEYVSVNSSYLSEVSGQGSFAVVSTLENYSSGDRVNKWWLLEKTGSGKWGFIPL